MPLPLLLVGAAFLAGGFGVKKGVDAKNDFDSAEHWNNKAQKLMNNAKSSLEETRDAAHEKMEKLGITKLSVWNESMIPFIEAFKTIKNMDVDTSGDYATSSLPPVNAADLRDMTRTSLAMKEVATDGLTALGSGGLAGLAAYGGAQVLATASTGTAISALSGAAATNATLAWFGGGSLATGGLGMAGGTAVLGGIVAGPVLAIGGMVLASKAEEAKINAYANHDEAELAAEQMKTAEVAAKGIGQRFWEVDRVIIKLNAQFTSALELFCEFVFQNPDYSTYTNEEKQEVYKISALAKTIKNLLDAPLLDENGAVTPDSREVLKASKAALKEL
jgi:hypothetical protein